MSNESKTRADFPAWLLATLILLLAPRGLAGDHRADEGLQAVPMVSLPHLQHVVRHFDFEEHDAAPNSLPTSFYRHIAANQGFPPFGSMRLTTRTAYGGAGSLEFELGGGSMSARIPTSIIPILPLTDYSVSARVRTSGLKHARARLVAWLHDKTGQPIPQSRSESKLVETGEQWESISVEVRSNDPDAADLVFELQVVQPGQFQPGDSRYAAHTHPDLDEFRTPRLEDVNGQAWFDDVVVSHLPHVRLAMSQGANIVTAPDVPEFEILVNELTSDSLTALLQIFDLDGHIVHESEFPAPRGRRPALMPVPMKRCGWFRALLHVRSDRGIMRTQSIDFVVLAPNRRADRQPNRFGVVLSPMPPSIQNHAASLVAALGSGTAIIPVWDRHVTVPPDQAQLDRRHALHDMIEQLLRNNVELIFSLDVVPDEVARAAGVEPNQVLKLLAKGGRFWQPYLDELLVNYGLEVNRWQVSGREQSDVLGAEPPQATVQQAHASLADFVPKPVLYTVRSIDQFTESADRLSDCALVIPHQVNPEYIREYASPFLRSEKDVTCLLRGLPDQFFSGRQRVAGLTIGGLHAWRAGLPLVSTEAPWRIGDDGKVEPGPMFCAWRALAEHLNGRRFVGEVPLATGLHCWLLRGKDHADSTLVAWSDQCVGLDAVSSTFQMQLAGGAITVIDIFGNRSVIEPLDGLHRVELHPTPVFIERANVDLVQFRGGVSIEPGFVPAIAKAHEHHIVLQNPWDVTISGAIRLLEEDEWKLSPNVQEFSIPAGGEARLPLNIIPQRSILSGQKVISAHVELQADQSYSMNVELPLEIGLKSIALAPQWSVARNPLTGAMDLIVTQAVTNHGTGPAHLDVFLQAEGVSQNRRTIAALGPGETAIRTFRIPDGAALLHGHVVRVGVAERDGLTRLNQLLSISISPNQLRTQATGP